METDFCVAGLPVFLTYFKYAPETDNPCALNSIPISNQPLAGNNSL
jgi:hypothetical protein